MKPPTHAETRQLLLDAAGGVFAERGFRDATVREICHRAGVNIAAVNYHFRGKEALYHEVLSYCYARALEKYPPDFGLKPAATAADRLEAFVRSFLFRIFDAGPLAWHGKLISREMIDPSGALNALVEQRFRPMAALLTGVIRNLLGQRASDEAVRYCAASVVSQCVFYHHCRSVVTRLFPEQRFAPEDIEQLASHITRFSLAGIRDHKQDCRPKRLRRHQADRTGN